MDFNMYVPTKILFGAGTLNELGKQQLPGKKAVIIISNGKSTRANGYLSRTEEQLAQAGVATSVFDKIQPNPLKETVMEGAAFVKAQGAQILLLHWAAAVLSTAPKPLPLWQPTPATYGITLQAVQAKGSPLKINRSQSLPSAPRQAPAAKPTPAALLPTPKPTKKSA